MTRLLAAATLALTLLAAIAAPLALTPTPAYAACEDQNCD